MKDHSNSDDAYIELLKQVLTASIYDESGWQIAKRHQSFLAGLRSKDELVLIKKTRYNAEKRNGGLDWPLFGYTMIGHKRLNNLQACINDVLDEGVDGDLIETGVWRGGATIFMRAMLRARSVTDRTVWVADSFQGLPKPVGPTDGKDLSGVDQLSVSLDQVKKNFQRFNLLDDQVQFLEGWFADTLPTAPINKLAILRLDGDLYSSTMHAMVALYPKVSPGGYVIVDDYATWPSCKRAITDYLEENSIEADIKMIDRSSAFWKVAKA